MAEYADAGCGTFCFYLAPVSRYHSYLNSAREILGTYKGEKPLASGLKKYFAAYKKFGSTDRKLISHLCYCFFRLGKAAMDWPVEERILASLLLCSGKPNELLEALKTEWNAKTGFSIEEKCSILNLAYREPDAQFSIFNVFPWKEELTEGIDHEKFSESFFIQPDLFIRIRPGKEKIVLHKLEQHGIDFSLISNSCIALPNSSKIETVVELNKEAVVQDYNSQRVGELLQNLKPLLRQAQDLNSKLSVWDCCAASGGKSIMAKDILGKIDLTVSDIRDSILVNLKKRFAAAGIPNFKSLIADVTNRVPEFGEQQFDLIIADVPCTGSGTWGRTPEQLYYFDENKIAAYAAVQNKIVTNIIPHLKPGGYLLYITCSVFKKENENQVEFLKEKFHLQLVKIPARLPDCVIQAGMPWSDGEVLKGYDKKADTMFAALLQKPQ